MGHSRRRYSREFGLEVIRRVQEGGLSQAQIVVGRRPTCRLFCDHTQS